MSSEVTHELAIFGSVSRRKPNIESEATRLDRPEMNLRVVSVAHIQTFVVIAIGATPYRGMEYLCGDY
jgi:hypothetical protein